MNREREIYGDILRIVAIFIVIIIHVIGKYRIAAYGVDGKYYIFLTFIDSFTRIAVPIFFMITGTFMLPRKTEKYSEYIRKRIPKLLILLIVASIGYYFYRCSYYKITPTVLGFITSFFDDAIKYHLWFLYVIILIYLLIPFLQPLVQNLDRKKLFNLIVLLAILSNGFNTIYLLTRGYDIGLFKAFTLPKIFSYINYVIMGYYFSQYKTDKKYNKVLFVISIISICLIPFADRFFVKDRIEDEMLAATSIFPIIPSIFTYIWFKNHFDGKNVSDKKYNAITKISACVLYIYLIHPFILDMLEEVILKDLICKSHYEELFRIFLNIILTSIVSLIISYFILLIKKLVINLKNKLYNKA